MRTLLRSFAGGEITPELSSRLDTAKFQTGLALCRNFEIRPYGPAVNRAGFEYVLDTQDSTKKSVLLPFIYSTSQAYALEFGDYYVRIHALGATVLETGLTISAITKAAPGVLTYAGLDPANGDTMFISCTGMTQLSGRFVTVANVDAGANTFELKDLNNVSIDTTAFGTFIAGSVARVYEIVSPYAEADLQKLEFTQSSDVLTITHIGYPTYELRRAGATSWSFTAVAFAPTQAAPTAPVVTPNGAGAVEYSYVVTAIATDGLEESLASGVATSAVCEDLGVAGAFNTVVWTNAAGATRYNVYRAVNGLYGYIGQSADGAVGFKDQNVAPDAAQTPPEINDPISSVGNYPGAVEYHQGRRVFAGSETKQQNVWATRSGTESNMTHSIPTRDDDAITARLTSRRANTIRHLVSLGDLLALTSGAEWLIDAGGNVGPITPGNIDYRVQGGTGAAQVRPVVTNNSVLYSADRGAHIQEIQFSWESQGYKSKDVSLMAPHLFDGYTIVSMAFVRAPFPALWCVRSDGVLLGLTYVPEHEVFAWHQHDTDGDFESVTSIPEGSEDVLYAIIKRTITGNVKRFVERLHSRRFASLADTFIVDCGLSYSGSPATVLSGAHHLVGKEVSILADGAVLPRQTVAAGGTITLQAAASKVAYGIPIVADLQTLPLVVEIEAFGQGTNKNVNKVAVKVHQSSSLFIGPSFDKLTEARHRSTEPYGSPPALRSGTIPVVIKPAWGVDTPLCVRQVDPLPLTVVGLVPDVASGG